MRKKFLSGLLIGAFIFGVGAADIQPVSASSMDKIKATKDKIDKTQNIFGKNKKSDDRTPPEPPKDENGNPMPPPDMNGNNSNDKYDKTRELFKN